MKQRIVGALVLLALGVLFVPLLFETDARRALDKTSQIPAAPDIRPMVVAEPTRNPDITPVKPAEQQYQLLPEDVTPAGKPEPVNPEPAKAAVEQPVSAPQAPAAPLVTPKTEPDRQLLGDNGIPNAWVVQVASLGSAERANALRDQLLSDGYSAFTRTFNSNGSQLTRVFVGPKISRDQAQELKDSLDKSLNMNTLVISFSP